MIFPPADTEPTMTRYQPLADCGKAFLTLPQSWHGHCGPLCNVILPGIRFFIRGKNRK